MTSSNGNVFRVTGHLCGEFTGHQWIPLTKASDAELWCFLWSAPWIYSWLNNRKAGDLRRHHAHYDIIVMTKWCLPLFQPMMVSILMHVQITQPQWVNIIKSVLSVKYWYHYVGAVVLQNRITECIYHLTSHEGTTAQFLSVNICRPLSAVYCLHS